jgi:hypothetical protein
MPGSHPPSIVAAKIIKSNEALLEDLEDLAGL